METQQPLLNIKKCTRRRYNDRTVENALYNMRNRQVSKTHILIKVRCLECKAYHVVRERKVI